LINFDLTIFEIQAEIYLSQRVKLRNFNQNYNQPNIKQRKFFRFGD